LRQVGGFLRVLPVSSTNTTDRCSNLCIVSVDRVECGLTSTNAVSAYNHYSCEFESWSGQGVQHYVIKFVSDLQQVGGFLSPGPPVSSTNKTDYFFKLNLLCQSTIGGKLYSKIVNKVVWGFDYLTGWVMDYTKYNQMKENIY
jgi:hypothetical protein